MNLHDIVQSMPNIDLIAEYCSHYYAMAFRPTGDRRHVEYQTHLSGDWTEMSERDTLSYTNAALEWHRNGRPLVR